MALTNVLSYQYWVINVYSTNIQENLTAKKSPPPTKNSDATWRRSLYSELQAWENTNSIYSKHFHD